MDTITEYKIEEKSTKRIEVNMCGTFSYLIPAIYQSSTTETQISERVIYLLNFVIITMFYNINENSILQAINEWKWAILSGVTGNG